MRIIEVTSPGGPDRLVPAVRPDPTPGAGEVLVRVAAAGVNRADLLQREGRYPPPPGAPDWPGLEIAGVVIGHGPDIDGSAWPLGARVAALLPGGGYAEAVTVPAGLLLPVPEAIDLVDAAGLPEAVCTAWSNLVDAGRLTAGEVLLVQGGSGGVGSVAVQIGAALGAHVIATAGGPERAARCRDLGARTVVDHRSQDVAEAVRAARSTWACSWPAGRASSAPPCGRAPSPRRSGSSPTSARTCGRCLPTVACAPSCTPACPWAARPTRTDCSTPARCSARSSW